MLHGVDMEIKIGIAKANKYAVAECGDSVEIAERPRGGMSAILADGQGSGHAAKTTSTLVVNKAAALIADGTRDGAVARAVHDYLYTFKSGKVSSTLTIISVDLDTQTVVFSRNSNCPVIVKAQYGIDVYDQDVNPIGVHKQMKPLIQQLPLEPGLILVSYSDGIQAAGKKKGRSIKLDKLLEIIQDNEPQDAGFIADSIMDYALETDGYQPGDDMTVLVVGIAEKEITHKIQRISVSFPY